jgi:hypothetical protein
MKQQMPIHTHTCKGVGKVSLKHRDWIGHMKWQEKARRGDERFPLLACAQRLDDTGATLTS